MTGRTPATGTAAGQRPGLAPRTAAAGDQAPSASACRDAAVHRPAARRTPAAPVTGAPAPRPLCRAPRTAAAVGAVFALLGALGALLGPGAGSAHAADYRYWSFWKGGADGWAFQQVGPTGNVPADGAVDGWRFVLSPDGGQDAPRPSPPADFAAICANTAPSGGHKRVAVVLDFGTAKDAPNGEQPAEARSVCASVPSAANSAEVLAAVAAPLRYDSAGLLCAIAGYPRAGCGEQVAAGSGAGSGGSASSDKGDGGPAVGVIAGVGAVVLLGAGAVWQARRRRTR
ncbi:SCO2322 family protein [Kitasatospora sp. NPDC048407]|uniref:SCO2322 family protein n=1 Tax=Kitasatospora sp. NPDC048407 TaxID=3364051 RepID=UPI00371B5ED9